MGRGRATRSPGKHQLLWDGRADNGQYVPAGQYTVLIEAVREHGTYGLIRQQVDLGDKPFEEQLRGNYEIRQASLEYREKKPSDESEGKSAS